jgi:hypothetical protein
MVAIQFNPLEIHYLSVLRPAAAEPGINVQSQGQSMQQNTLQYMQTLNTQRRLQYSLIRLKSITCLC